MKRHSGFVFAATCLLGACGPPTPQSREWTEDVLLSPTRTIQVRRAVVFDETNSLSSDAFNRVEQAATISFVGDLADVPTWQQSLMPLVIYQSSTQEWVVVATTTSCEVWQTRGEPEPLYWEFRLRDGRWTEVPQSEESIGKAANLLHRYRRAQEDSHVTIAERERAEADSTMDVRFREIVRHQKVNCMPRTNDEERR